MDDDYNGVKVKVVKVLATTSGSYGVMGRSLGSVSAMEFYHLFCIWTLLFLYLWQLS